MYDLRLGDSLEVLSKFADNHFDAVVTDPPYGLISIVKRFGKEKSAPAKFGNDGSFSRLSKGFMGHDWDGQGIEYNVDFWKEVLRVSKPGAHMLAFSATKTYHRMTSAIEDAGFEIRDMITWNYGTGMPKSHHNIDGKGTALKPSIEPICVARKPFQTTIKDNVDEWNTGVLNIDDARIDERWPTNFIHDGSDEILASLGDAAKFYYCAKPSPKEREETKLNNVSHPTIKPLALMRYLVKLVTPKDGKILDPFMGSGTTGKAALLENRMFVGIEKNKEYFDISEKRITSAYQTIL